MNKLIKILLIIILLTGCTIKKETKIDEEYYQNILDEYVSDVKVKLGEEYNILHFYDINNNALGKYFSAGILKDDVIGKRNISISEYDFEKMIYDDCFDAINMENIFML